MYSQAHVCYSHKDQGNLKEELKQVLCRTH